MSRNAAVPVTLSSAPATRGRCGRQNFTVIPAFAALTSTGLLSEPHRHVGAPLLVHVVSETV